MPPTVQAAPQLPAEASGLATVIPGVVGSSQVSTVAGATPRVLSSDGIRLADAEQCKVYVCYEGPLGSHLKAEVRDKIWKGDYVEIFSLLPLEKFKLDKVKPDQSKKEEEEKQRYRFIPRMFANWLQAFNILPSVIGEKALENCSALFCYLDSISEAQRVYGGVA